MAKARRSNRAGGKHSGAKRPEDCSGHQVKLGISDYTDVPMIMMS